MKLEKKVSLNCAFALLRATTGHGATGYYDVPDLAGGLGVAVRNHIATVKHDGRRWFSISAWMRSADGSFCIVEAEGGWDDVVLAVQKESGAAP